MAPIRNNLWHNCRIPLYFVQGDTLFIARTCFFTITDSWKCVENSSFKLNLKTKVTLITGPNPAFEEKIRKPDTSNYFIFIFNRNHKLKGEVAVSHYQPSFYQGPRPVSCKYYLAKLQNSISGKGCVLWDCQPFRGRGGDHQMTSPDLGESAKAKPTRIFVLAPEALNKTMDIPTIFKEKNAFMRTHLVT